VAVRPKAPPVRDSTPVVTAAARWCGAVTSRPTSTEGPPPTTPTRTVWGPGDVSWGMVTVMAKAPAASAVVVPSSTGSLNSWAARELPGGKPLPVSASESPGAACCALSWALGVPAGTVVVVVEASVATVVDVDEVDAVVDVVAAVVAVVEVAATEVVVVEGPTVVDVDEVDEVEVATTVVVVEAVVVDVVESGSDDDVVEELVEEVELVVPVGGVVVEVEVEVEVDVEVEVEVGPTVDVVEGATVELVVVGGTVEVVVVDEVEVVPPVMTTSPAPQAEVTGLLLASPL
jgi:hypothetical protein